MTDGPRAYRLPLGIAHLAARFTGARKPEHLTGIPDTSCCCVQLPVNAPMLVTRTLWSSWCLSSKVMLKWQALLCQYLRL
jgi:hypothetical protein